MALSATTLWELNTSATASNVNGGGFNYANANFLTDYTATSATGNSPVISSASYTFVAGDVGAWIYVQAGTNWTPGFYKITAVNAGAATVNATIGAAVQLSAAQKRWIPNTVAGCATTASPTGGTCGIDYSQGTAAIINNTDLASSNGTTNPSTCTSAGSPFGVNHVGNIMHVTAGTNFTATWYEIVSVSGVTATLDKALGSAASISGGTFYVGGALSLGHSSDDAVFELAIAGNTYFAKTGTFTFSSTVTTSAAGSTSLAVNWEGYESIRGDRPTGSTRPKFIIASGTTYTSGQYWYLRHLQFESSSGTDPFVTVTLAANSSALWVKSTNFSTTVDRAAFYMNTDTTLIYCEAIARLGRGVNCDGTVFIYGCYFHSSDRGVRLAGTTLGHFVINCLFESIKSIAISFGSANTSNSLIMGNTVYGFEDKASSYGVYFTSGCTEMRLINNIIYGHTTGVFHGSSGQTLGTDLCNVYYNNTTNVSDWNISSTSSTAAISFPGVAQVTGTTATTSGGVLTDAGADFSAVVDNQDYAYLVSGTGISTNVKYFLITAHTTTTITLSPDPGDSATGNIVYKVTTGRDFTPSGSGVIGTGAPGAFPGGLTTSYIDIGGVQTQYGSGIAASLAGGGGRTRRLGMNRIG